jgi:hypothetical protein
MKLIIIYGAPATGKLTVATELSRITGYKVFHNHISINFAKTVFDFGTPAFWRLVAEVRFNAIAEAAREGLSLIHTFCYEFGADDEHFAKLIASAEDNRGEAHLVLFRCDNDERKKRIGSESRLRIGKLVDPDHIDRSKVELSTPFPGRETLIFDTTETPAETVAARIVEHFGLQRQIGDL